MKIWEALLIYNLIWSLLSSRFLTGPCFLRRIPSFLRRYLSSVFFFAVIARVRTSGGCLTFTGSLGPHFTIKRNT